jgi:hypothetical protein
MYMLDDYYDNESIDVKREIKMEYDDSTHVKKEIKEEDDTDDFYDADADELSLLIDLTVADAVELQKAKILQAQANERIIEELSDDIKVNQVLIQAQDAMILMLDRKSADYVQVMNEKTRLLQEKESMQEKLNEFIHKEERANRERNQVIAMRTKAGGALAAATAVALIVNTLHKRSKRNTLRAFNAKTMLDVQAAEIEYLHELQTVTPNEKIAVLELITTLYSILALTDLKKKNRAQITAMIAASRTAEHELSKLTAQHPLPQRLQDYIASMKVVAATRIHQTLHRIAL